MASSNIKLFDENKGNMLSDSEFSISNQRLNGLQTGVASSQLQNKAMYQASLVAYAIAQIMMQNGKNANDTDAVSAFVANLSGAMLQKVYDLATTEEAKAGVATGKWMSPALVKAAIDTLAAPAGYGLGDKSTGVTDFNLCNQNGWYGGISSTINGPEKIEYNEYGAVHVRRGNSTIVCQDYYIFDSNNLPYGLLATRFSSDYGANWSPWEYVNPEMKIGVEYRTTERYLGKPVYVKVVDCGAMPNTTTKAVSHGVANIDKCISATGITIISTGDTFSIPYVSMSDGVTNGCSLSRTQVRVWSAGDDSTANANVLIKYTKTTD